MAISHGFTLIPVAFEIAYDKSCHILYKLRIAPCFALPQSYRYERFRRVSHGFTLIPVAFEIAYSLLHTLRGRWLVCVFEELIQ